MDKLNILKNQSGVSKTLRLPEDIVQDVQHLSEMKNLSFNKSVIILLSFSLHNLDEVDRSVLDKFRKN